MCGKTFKNDSTLVKHGRNTHVLTQEYVCEYCDAKFKAKDSLVRHKKEKHLVGTKVDWNQVEFVNELKHKCEICDKYFSRKANLKVHINMVHESSGNENKHVNRCSFCQKEFSTKSSCKRHEKVCQLKNS